jgi:hypothetical protein
MEMGDVSYLTLLYKPNPAVRVRCNRTDSTCLSNSFISPNSVSNFSCPLSKSSCPVCRLPNKNICVPAHAKILQYPLFIGGTPTRNIFKLIFLVGVHPMNRGYCRIFACAETRIFSLVKRRVSGIRSNLQGTSH